MSLTSLFDFNRAIPQLRVRYLPDSPAGRGATKRLPIKVTLLGTRLGQSRFTGDSGPLSIAQNRTSTSSGGTNSVPRRTNCQRPWDFPGEPYWELTPRAQGSESR